MKNYIFVLFSFFAFFSTYCCSESIEDNEYRESVRKFYEVLLVKNVVSIGEMEAIYLNSDYEEVIRDQKIKESYTMNSNSVLLDSIKRYNFQLTHGFKYDSICSLIYKSKIFNEGEPFSNILELKFSKEISCFFEINNDTPKTIQFIWLPTGEDLKGKLLHYGKVEKYLRPGIINDIDGYTNIRADANIKSSIVGKVVKDEIFYYCPNSYSNWWAIFKSDNCIDNPIGYIFKNRITTYDKFPIMIKNKVDKIKSGC